MPTRIGAGRKVIIGRDSNYAKSFCISYKKKKSWDGMVSGLFYRWQDMLWETEFAQGLSIGKRWRQDLVPKEQIPFTLLDGRAT